MEGFNYAPQGEDSRLTCLFSHCCRPCSLEQNVLLGGCLVSIDSDHSELVILPSNDPDKSVTFGELKGTSEYFLGH